MSPWTNIAMFTPIFLRQKVLDSCKTLGFIAHMDTVSDFCDHPVTPVITENYDGGELPLGTSAEFFPRKCSRIFLL